MTAKVPNWYKGDMDCIHPLKAFRERHDPPLSQGQLAKLLDVNRVDVTRWENGTRKPGVKTLPKIVEKTGIAPAALRPDLAEAMAGSEYGDSE